MWGQFRHVIYKEAHVCACVYVKRIFKRMCIMRICVYVPRTRMLCMRICTQITTPAGRTGINVDVYGHASVSQVM
jgi:hypothetical protein